MCAAGFICCTPSKASVDYRIIHFLWGFLCSFIGTLDASQVQTNLFPRNTCAMTLCFLPGELRQREEYQCVRTWVWMLSSHPTPSLELDFPWTLHFFTFLYISLHFSCSKHSSCWLHFQVLSTPANLTPGSPTGTWQGERHN